MSSMLITNARISDEQELMDILMEDGKIKDIAENIDSPDTTSIDVEGQVVLPTFIESHIHPDKAFLEERMPNKSGTLDEAIKNTSQLKSGFTHEDVTERAEKVIQWALKHGTTIMRAHPDVDPFEKVMGVEVMVELKEKYKDIMDIQIVAFPQEGFIKHPEVFDMMKKSIEIGADVVGACPYVENTLDEVKEHIRMVFDLAKEHDLPVDMHVDFTDNLDDPRYTMTEFICEETIKRGYQGKVTLGHVTTLGSMDPEKAAPLFDKIAEAGITIVPLPATDMYLNGRKATHNIPRGMAPVQALMKHGVNMVYASNNIRNAFTPFGNANLLTVGYLLADSQHMGSVAQQRSVLDMVTVNAAKCLGIEDTYGLEVGKYADLVVLDSKKLSDVLSDQPVASYVIKRGEVLLTNNLETEYSTKLQQLMGH